MQSEEYRWYLSKEALMENDIIRVKVLGMGAALSAGFVPDQGHLKHPKSGASIPQSTFAANAGKIRKAIQTGATTYPVTIEGVIYHEGLVSAEAQKVEYKTSEGSKRELVRFHDGSLAIDRLNGEFEVVTADQIEAVYALESKPSHK